MAKEKIVVPDIGGAEGAEVIELLVEVGDEVQLEQGLIVLESDKASMEIPSSMAGTVVEILTEVGKELAEGDPMVLLETAASEVAAPETVTAVEAPAAEPPPAEKAAPAPVAPAEKDLGPVQVPVPDIGTDEAVDLIELCVAVGDEVGEGDSLVVLESDKASMEVPAPFAGSIVEVLAAEGSSIKMGDPLMMVKPVSSGTAPVAVESVEAAPAPRPAATVAAEKAPPAAPVPAAAATAPTKGVAGSLYAGPSVRKLAREFGVELAQVTATGPRGRILKEDLQAYVKNSLSGSAPAAATGVGIPAIPAVDFAAFGPVEEAPLSKMSKLTAANMQRNWLNVPHVTQFDDADITDLEAFRAQMKPEGEKRGVKLTPLPFMLKACAVALRDNPKFRSSLSSDGQNLVTKHYVHIGMAVDTPAGLLVPVLRDVDKKSLWELAEEVVEMAGLARDRKLKPVDMQGACFTISSLGNIGGKGLYADRERA